MWFSACLPWSPRKLARSLRLPSLVFSAGGGDKSSGDIARNPMASQQTSRTSLLTLGAIAFGPGLLVLYAMLVPLVFAVLIASRPSAGTGFAIGLPDVVALSLITILPPLCAFLAARDCEKRHELDSPCPGDLRRAAAHSPGACLPDRCLHRRGLHGGRRGCHGGLGPQSAGATVRADPAYPHARPHPSVGCACEHDHPQVECSPCLFGPARGTMTPRLSREGTFGSDSCAVVGGVWRRGEALRSWDAGHQAR